jgi:hypothetical protein
MYAEKKTPEAFPFQVQGSTIKMSAGGAGHRVRRTALLGVRCWSAMKDPTNAGDEQLRLFDVTQLLDPNDGSTIAWIIFPRSSEELE